MPTTHRVLHLVGSPSGPKSRTRAVAEHFIAAYQRLRPGVQVETMDAWQEDLPPFDAEMIEAKFAVLRKQQATPAQRALWNRAVQLARRFNAADLYVLSVPMWNYGVPYRMKHLIDVLTLPEENWRWTPSTGYQALLHGKRAVVAYSSAGAYPLEVRAGSTDHQKGFVRDWLAFVGIRDVLELNVAPTLAPPTDVAATLEASRHQAEDLARRLAQEPAPRPARAHLSE